MLRRLFFIFFICALVSSSPKPDEPEKTEDKKPEDAPAGDAPAPAADAPPGGAEAAPAGADAAADAATSPTEAGAAGAADATPAGDATETTAADGKAGEGGAETSPVQLTIPMDFSTPLNAFTNRFGQPVKESEIINITLKDGGLLQIYTESWMTYYTRPATKPGCMCFTRGPLPKFKLIGNIHFPKIKVTTESYVSVPTEPASTLCPPCQPCPKCMKGQDNEYPHY